MAHGEVGADLHQLDADGVEPATLETGDDLADEPALHRVGLDQHKGALCWHGLSSQALRTSRRGWGLRTAPMTAPRKPPLRISAARERSASASTARRRSAMSSA